MYYAVAVNDDFHRARVAEIRLKAGTTKLADIIRKEELDLEKFDSAGGGCFGRLTLAPGEGVILAIEREDVKTDRTERSG